MITKINADVVIRHAHNEPDKHLQSVCPISYMHCQRKTEQPRNRVQKVIKEANWKRIERWRAEEKGSRGLNCICDEDVTVAG